VAVPTQSRIFATHAGSLIRPPEIVVATIRLPVRVRCSFHGMSVPAAARAA